MAYTPIGWLNDQAPAINQTNLNKMDNELVALDKASNDLVAFQNRMEKTNVLFSAGSITISGVGAYVSQEICRENAIPGEKYTASFDLVSGATTSNYIYMRFYDSSDTQIAQTGSGANKTLTSIAPANTAKVAVRLSAANGTALPTGSATFTNVVFAHGTVAKYEINPDMDYERMDLAESEIEQIKDDFNDVICYNLMGNDSSIFYPIEKLVAGDKVTFSKKDGSAFATDSTLACGFCEISGSVRINRTLNSGTTTITYTVPSGLEFNYLKWNATPGDIMVARGASAREYVKYNNDTLEVDIRNLKSNVENIENGINLNNNSQGFLALGEMKNGFIPFTKDNVKPGDIVHYHFISPNGAILGLLRMRDSADNNLNFYINESIYATTMLVSFVGRDAAARPSEYKGSFIIPENFDHCIVQCNSTYTITVSELYINRYEERIALEAMDIPEYYFINNYLPAKAQTINERLESCLSKGDAFIFITDLHLKSNQKHSPALIHYLYQNTSIRKLVYGGDLLDGGLANEYPISRKYTKEMREAFPSLQMFCVGNHDTFQNNPSSRISTWADTTIEKYIGDSNKHYFYYDDNRAKIRYIILNRYYTGDQNTSSGFYVDSVQRDWFENTALDMENGYGAVIFIHNLYNFNYTVENPIMTIDEGCEAYLSDVADAYNANQDSKGEVICIVQGHTHSDRILQTTGGIPIIITTCDKNLQADPAQPDILFPEGVEDRESGTIREQAFDVIIVDRIKDANNKGTIYAIRVGCEAYNGTTVSDMGTATQERTVQYNEKF